MSALLEELVVVLLAAEMDFSPLRLQRTGRVPAFFVFGFLFVRFGFAGRARSAPCTFGGNSRYVCIACRQRARVFACRSGRG